MDKRPTPEEIEAEPIPSKNNAPDPFDPARYRLASDYSPVIGVSKLLTTVPVRKPARPWFVRTHPSDAYRLDTVLLDLKEEQETYLVAPELLGHLGEESTLSTCALFTAINRQGTVFLWPVKLTSGARTNSWNTSALDAALRAREGWVRVQANMSLGAYEVIVPESNLPDPEWPELALRELLSIAFKDRLITSLDHPVLRDLRGAV